MNSKKFTFILVLSTLGNYLLLNIIYFIVNPEQIYNYSITEKKYFYTKEFSKKQFKELNSNRSILIFGTSQSHMIGTEMMKFKTLNFHNLYSEPGDILNFLHQLNKTQMKNIHEIIYLIDLRAGAIREDVDLINYEKNSIFFPINYQSVFRIFLDLKYNLFPLNNRPYLKSDGSIFYSNPIEHINNIESYGLKNSASLRFNENLIKKIIAINNFCEENDIRIKYITPVVNDKYFATINLNDLNDFYNNLISNGLKNLSLYYFIEGMSNNKNANGDYISFVEKDHLNQFYVEYWLNNFIKKDSIYTISNKKDLDNLFREYNLLQNKNK